MSEEILSKIAELRKILVGNGEVGLCEQTRKNTEDIQEIKADVVGKWIMRTLWFILAAGQGLLAYKVIFK